MCATISPHILSALRATAKSVFLLTALLMPEWSRACTQVSVANTGWQCAEWSSKRHVHPLPSCRHDFYAGTLAVPSSGAGWTVAGGRPPRAAAAAATASPASPSSESERLVRLTDYLGDRGVELGLGWSCKVTPKCAFDQWAGVLLCFSTMLEGMASG